jgi:hypothetical protein
MLTGVENPSKLMQLRMSVLDGRDWLKSARTDEDKHVSWECPVSRLEMQFARSS